MRRIVNKIFALVAFQSAMMLIAVPAYAGTLPGEQLFQNNCLRCHASGPGSFSTPAAGIREILESRSIRKHRFTLSPDQIEQIIEYCLAVNQHNNDG